MPRHVVTMMGVVFAFFVLLWFGVVILGRTPAEAFVASLLTLLLVGIGVTFSVTTLRRDQSHRE